MPKTSLSAEQFQVIEALSRTIREVEALGAEDLATELRLTMSDYVMAVTRSED